MKMSVAFLESGGTTDNSEEKRWKAKIALEIFLLEHQTKGFSWQSAGLRGDGVVISWQWGAGHVGTTWPTSKTPDLERTDTHTLSVSVCDISLLLSISFSSYFSSTKSSHASLVDMSKRVWRFRTSSRKNEYRKVLTASQVLENWMRTEKNVRYWFSF